MHQTFLIVALVLFAVAVLLSVLPSPPAWSRGFTPLGLAFFAAAFLTG